MPVWIGDYLGATTHLNLQTHGAYFLLLINMWSRGGSLSASPAYLSRVLGIEVSEFEHLWKTLQEFFPISGGKITNKRLSVELVKARKRVRAGKKGGIASGKARMRKKLEAKREPNDSPTILERPSNDSSNDHGTDDPTTREAKSETSPSPSPIRVKQEQTRGPGPHRPERAEDIEIPHNLGASSAFVEVWKHWLKHRRENRWTTKPGWAKSQLKSLAKHGPAVAIAALQESMIQGWQGVFPDKVSGKTGAPAHGRVDPISAKYRREGDQ